jgi:hypothetical protein
MSAFSSTRGISQLWKRSPASSSSHSQRPERPAKNKTNKQKKKPVPPEHKDKTKQPNKNPRRKCLY